MMDLLKEWLGPTIERELNAAIQWRECTPRSTRLSDDNRYEDDGSNLRTKLLASGVVQITKLVRFKDPIDIWISDSSTRLRATIAASAAQKFFLETKKRITQDTLGGLIQILDFEIVATHLGPRESRLTLLIKDFKSLGSEGSGSFGSPRPIELNNNIQQFLQHLAEFRAQEPKDRWQQVRPPSSERDLPVYSQKEFEPSSDDGPMASPQAFATQVPHGQPRDTLRLRFAKSPGLSDQQDPWTKTQQVTIEDPSSQLQNQKKGTSSTLPPHQPLAGAPTNETKKPAHLKSLQKFIDQNQRLGSLPQPKLISNAVTPDPMIKSRNEGSKDPEVMVQPETRVGGNDKPTVTSTDLAKLEEDKPISQEMSTSNELPKGDHFHNKTIRNLADSVAIDHACLASSGFANRISSKDIRILSAQHNLLQRPDSWIPAEPGQSPPVANVPIETLQGINRLVEIHENLTLERKQTNEQPLGTMLPQRGLPALLVGIESQCQSDSRTSVSPSAWPPSSPPQKIREELPPDSSMETPTQSKVFQEKHIEEQHVQPNPRSPSNTSVSSDSVILIRKKNPRASKESPTPLLSSPSRFSASGINDLRPIKCPVDGCTKSCMKAQSLKLHNHKCHGGSVSPQLRSGTDTSNSEALLSSTVNWYACSKSQKILDASGDVASQRCGSECFTPSKERQTKLTSISTSSTVPKKDRNSDLNLLSQFRSTNGLINEFQQAESCLAEKNVNQDIQSPSGVPFSEPEIFENGPQSSPKFGVAVPTTQQRDPIYFKNSVENDISVNGHSTILSDTQSSNRGSSFSTTSQPADSMVQVKDTPYVNGQISDVGVQTFQLHASPSPSTTTNIIVKDIKRKISETVLSLHNVTKRRRRLIPYSQVEFTQVNQDMPDPSVFARRYRQEFLESRKDPLLLPKAEDVSLSPQRNGKHEDSTLNTKFSSSASEIQQDLGLTVNARLSGLQGVDGMQSSIAPSENLQVRHTRSQTPIEESLDIAMLDVDTYGVAEMVPFPNDMGIGCAKPSASANVFKRFKIAYPDYLGNMNQFVAICLRIQKLVDAGRGEHQTLWDDFIIRHKTEYPKYCARCIDDAEDAVPYEQFYRKEIDVARYNKQVITRKTLQEALALGVKGRKSASPQQQAKNATEEANALDSRSNEGLPAQLDIPQNIPRHESPHVFIDLTIDNEELLDIQEPFNLPRIANQSSPTLSWVTPTKTNDDIPPSKFSTEVSLLFEPEIHSTKPLRPQIQPKHPTKKEVVESRNLPNFSPSKAAAIERVNLSAYNRSSTSSGTTQGEKAFTSAKNGINDHTIQSPGSSTEVFEVRSGSDDSAKKARTKYATKPIFKIPTKLLSPKPTRQRREREDSLSLGRQARATQDASLSSKCNSGEMLQIEESDAAEEMISSFAKAYLAIRPGNGNSYAQTKGTESRNEIKDRQEGIQRGFRRLDISSWQLN